MPRTSPNMEVVKIVEELVARALQELQTNPMAVPVLGSLAAVLFAIVLLYTCAGGKKKAERTGTVMEGGIRRSTR